MQSIADKGALAPGLSVVAAADILWALNHPSLYALLTGERDWTPQRYERWLSDLLVAQLIAGRGGTTS